jgi:hypothetical protein
MLTVTCRPSTGHGKSPRADAPACLCEPACLPPLRPHGVRYLYRSRNVVAICDGFIPVKIDAERDGDIVDAYEVAAFLLGSRCPPIRQS